MQAYEKSAVIFQKLLDRYPSLEVCSNEIKEAYTVLLKCAGQGHCLLVAGNGGSAADSEHITGELMKSFRIHRSIDLTVAENLREYFGTEGEKISEQLEGCITAIPLTGFPSLSSAYANDAVPNMTFAQMVYGYGRAGDVLLGITTSGNSENIYKALMVAKAKSLTTICLTGRSGGRCSKISNITIHVPEDETYLIQELHLPVYHALCAMLEADIFINKE